MKTLIELQKDVKASIEKAIESVRYRVWEYAQWQEITTVSVVPTAKKDCEINGTHLTVSIAKANAITLALIRQQYMKACKS